MDEEKLELEFVISPEMMFRVIKTGTTRMGTKMPRRLHIRNALRVVVLALVVAIGTILLERFFHIEPSFSFLIFGALAAVGLVVILQQSSLIHLSETIVSAGGNDGRTRTTIDRNGVCERNGMGEVRLAWRAFEEYVDMRDGLILRFGGLLLAVPDAALPDEIDRTGLKRLIDEVSQ